MKRALFISILVLLTANAWGQNTSCKELLEVAGQNISEKLGQTPEYWQKRLKGFPPISSKQKQNLQGAVARMPTLPQWQRKFNQLFFWRIWAVEDVLRVYVKEQAFYDEFSVDYNQLTLDEQRAIFLRLTGRWWYNAEPSLLKKVMASSKWVNPIQIFYKFLNFLYKKVRAFKINKAKKSPLLISRVEDLFKTSGKPGFFKSLFYHHAQELYMISEFKKVYDPDILIEILERRSLQLQLFNTLFDKETNEYKYTAREIARAEILLLGLSRENGDVSKHEAAQIYERYQVSKKDRWKHFNFKNLLNNSVKISTFLTFSSLGLVAGHLYFESPTIEQE